MPFIRRLMVGLVVSSAWCLVAGPGQAEPAKLNIAVFGDSSTRGLYADSGLGQLLPLTTLSDFAQIGTAIKLAQYIPEGQPALAYPVMQNAVAAARDPLAAVQGTTAYALNTKLAASGGRDVRVSTLAYPGGSYRTADAQLAAYKTALASRAAEPADLIVVDLGRVDFALFPAPTDFAQQVQWFFARLTAISPHARILVARVPDVVGQIDQADRVAFYAPPLGSRSCAAIDREAPLGGASGLRVGADNSLYLSNARSRLAAYNAVLEQTVAGYQAAGTAIQLVSSLNERFRQDEWDQILAADCQNLNRAGQEEVAAHLLPAALALLAGPPSNPPMPPPPLDAGDSASAPFTERGHELWDTYVNRLPLAELQPECVPRLVMPPSTVAYRGMILLVPGVTACPQLYDDVTASLAAKGYAVVLPLVPGEGRKWKFDDKGARVDQIDEVATGRVGDPRSYRKVLVGFVQEMNQIAAEFRGERAVAGISLGGALASAIVLDRPSLWDRQMLISPFYEYAKGETLDLFKLVVGLDRVDSHLVDLVKDKLEERRSYGDFCENWREHRPTDPTPNRKLRAGVCQIRGTNVLADNQIGFDTLSLIAPTTVKTQVLVVQGDPVINLERPYNAVGRMRGEELGEQPYTSKVRLDRHPDVRVCYAPSDPEICKANFSLPRDQQKIPCVSHALLFGYDDPIFTGYWVPYFVPKMVNFLTEGQYMETDATLGRYQNDPICAGFPH